MVSEGPTQTDLALGKLTGRLSVGAAIETDNDEARNRFNVLKSSVYPQFFKAMKDDEPFYRLKFGDDILPTEWKNRGFKAVIPPTAYNAVEASVDHILTIPNHTVPPRPVQSSTLAELDIAENKAELLDHVWYNFRLMGDPLRAGTKKLIKDGKIVLKKEIDFKRVVQDGNGLIGQSGFPWKLRVLPNDTVYEDPDNPHDPRYVYESYNIRIDSVRNLLPVDQFDKKVRDEWSKGKKGTDSVQFLEYWQKPNGEKKGRRVIWLDNVKVLDKINPYYWVDGVTPAGKDRYDGYVPYFIGASGWGDVGADNNPADRYVGMIRYIHSVLEAEARHYTDASVQMHIAAFPIIKAFGFSEDKEKPLRVGPGATLFIPDKASQDIEIMTWPGLTPGVSDMISRAHSYVSELSKFEALGGDPQVGVNTATEAAQNSSNALAKLQAPLASLSSVVARIDRTIFQDIELIFEQGTAIAGAGESGGTVAVVKPEDISGFYEVFVEMQSSDDAAQLRANARLWADMFRIFGLDREFSMRKAGIPRPRQRIANRIAEDLLLDPRMHEIRMMLASSGLGRAGEIVAKSVEQGLAAGGPSAEKPATPQALLTGNAATEGSEDLRRQALEEQFSNRSDFNFQ